MSILAFKSAIFQPLNASAPVLSVASSILFLNLAMRRQHNLLPDLQVRRIGIGIEPFDLTKRGLVLLRKVVEGVARDDIVRGNSALSAGAYRDVDELANEDEIRVFDLRIGSHDSVQGDLE